MILSELMVQAARDLEGETGSMHTMDHAAQLALVTVDSADAVTLSSVGKGRRVDTTAATDEAARSADGLQHETGQGPCLDAIWEQPIVQVSDISTETRWPTWAARMAESSGFGSMLVFRLYTHKNTAGALSLYAGHRNAFDDEALELGTALAAHIAIALRASKQIENLELAVAGRTLIGQAQGILMERFDLDAAKSFAVLTRISITAERKLRDIAEEIVLTREVPD